MQACSDRSVDIEPGASIGSAHVDARVAVLASGAGSNLQALLDDPVVGSQIALVVSDRPDARPLDRARARGVKAVLLDRTHYGTRERFDEALEAVLEDEAIESVLLAGFMRIL